MTDSSDCGMVSTESIYGYTKIPNTYQSYQLWMGNNQHTRVTTGVLLLLGTRNAAFGLNDVDYSKNIYTPNVEYNAATYRKCLDLF